MLLTEPVDTPVSRAITRCATPPIASRIATSRRVCMSIGLPRGRRTSRSPALLPLPRTPSASPIAANPSALFFFVAVIFEI